jgi:hypothetical protein
MSVPSKLFDNLTLDSWFKTVTYLGGVLIVFSLFFPVQVVTNSIITIFGTGMFIFGMGRWKNQKTRSWREPGGIVSVTNRKPDVFGLLLEAVGIFVVLYGFWVVIAQQVGI